MILFFYITKSNTIFINFLSFPFVKSFFTILLVPIILKLITISKRTANVSTAEEFETKFKDLLGNSQKIVIFIDDLDRCSPKTVKVILDSLKTFFQHPECSYIITGDHTVVEQYAGNELDLPDGTGAAEKLKQGRRFLKKLFDVYWRLPLPTLYQFEIFVNKELEVSKIALSQDQLSTIKSFLNDNDVFERNPRHVKRFITKLRFALAGVSLQKKELEDNQDKLLQDSKDALDDILLNPDLLAKVLLFEEFFYPVYEKLILNPEELISHEKLLRANNPSSTLTIHNKPVLALLKKIKLDKIIDLKNRVAEILKSWGYDEIKEEVLGDKSI